jgi:hypothetical protein
LFIFWFLSLREEIESQWITIKRKKSFVGHIMATKIVNLDVFLISFDKKSSMVMILFLYEHGFVYFLFD